MFIIGSLFCLKNFIFSFGYSKKLLISKNALVGASFSSLVIMYQGIIVLYFLFASFKFSAKISNKYFPTNEMTSVVTLDPKIEQEIMGSVKQTEQGAYINLAPEKTQSILNSVKEEVDKMEELGKNPIIVTSPIVRMYFKKITSEQFKDLIVVSYNEIDTDVELQSIGMVTV